MALAYSDRAIKDLRRLVDFVRVAAPEAATSTGEIILEALDILERHPLIGRAVSERLRELIISRGRSGYVALYHVDEPTGEILVVAIRHQRESGYHEEDL